MSKVHSKLATGLQKVKAQQANSSPANEKATTPGKGAAKAKVSARPENTASVRHPERVWPD